MLFILMSTYPIYLKNAKAPPNLPNSPLFSLKKSKPGTNLARTYPKQKGSTLFTA